MGFLFLLAIIAGLFAIGQLLRFIANRKQLKAESLRREREGIEEKIHSIDQERKRAEQDIEEKRQHARQEIRKESNRLENRKGEIRKLAREAEKRRGRCIKEVHLLAEQKSQGFPWLAEAYAEYFQLELMKKAEALEHKKHPAPKSAERVRDIARARRVVERKLRIAQGIIKYWRSLFPFLVDFMGNQDEELLKRVLARNIDHPIHEISELQEDPVMVLLKLSGEEYRRLSSAERSQRALDKWRARSETKWQIGRQYERYIGYLFEHQGYKVYYQGILEGFDDLGRDLICKGPAQTYVIQCKCWSRHKEIHENHVNQLFGTGVKYRLDNPTEQVNLVLWTSTELTERARRFADHLGVQIKESQPLKEYPCIKCNISRATGEKIYHLPFDQQYDNTVVEPERGELYVSTAYEAEKLGFRRAWRWKGKQEGTSSAETQGRLF